MASCYVITDSNVLLKTCKSRVKKKKFSKEVEIKWKDFQCKDISKSILWNVKWNYDCLTIVKKLNKILKDLKTWMKS